MAPARTPAPPRPPAARHVAVRNLNVPGSVRRVDAGTHEAMRGARPDTPQGLTRAETFRAVEPLLSGRLFPGGAKAPGWAKFVQLDLDARGVVARKKGTPLRWRRAAAGGARA